MPLSPSFEVSQAHEALCASLELWAQRASPDFAQAGLTLLPCDLQDPVLLSYQLPVEGPCAVTASLTFVCLSNPAGTTRSLAWVLDCDDEACTQALGLLMEFCPVYSAGSRTTLTLAVVEDALLAQAPETVIDWAASTLEAHEIRHRIVQPLACR